MVCMSRAVAHGRTPIAGFSDPTALALLPEDRRAWVERVRSGAPRRKLRERIKSVFLERHARPMVLRAVAIDEAVRSARTSQLVILGAGLDGRGWRMPELADVTVFEVDHPDTQREKRRRVEPLKQMAREVRFVPVDFTRDRLDDALPAAGHDASKPTTWIWEGVVMYLTQAEIEASLEAISRHSAPGSRLIIVYHRPALVLKVINRFTRKVGEPLRSAFTAGAMRSLLERFGFGVVRDEDFSELGARLVGPGGRSRFLRHVSIVTADRTAASEPQIASRTG